MCLDDHSCSAVTWLTQILYFGSSDFKTDWKVRWKEPVKWLILEQIESANRIHAMNFMDLKKGFSFPMILVYLSGGHGKSEFLRKTEYFGVSRRGNIFPIQKPLRFESDNFLKVIPKDQSFFSLPTLTLFVCRCVCTPSDPFQVIKGLQSPFFLLK